MTLNCYYDYYWSLNKHFHFSCKILWSIKWYNFSVYKARVAFLILFTQPALPHLTLWNCRLPSNSTATSFCNPFSTNILHNLIPSTNFLPHKTPSWKKTTIYFCIWTLPPSPLLAIIHQHKDVLSIAIQLLLKLLGMDLLNTFWKSK